MKLDKLPLTTNGKVDKKALPDPDGLGLSSGVEYLAPRNDTEERLLLIWQDILGREQIGVKDNFFDLGGHSLKVIRLINQIHKEFGMKLALKELFTKSVLEDQAKLIQTGKAQAFISIACLPEQEKYVLSSSQKRLWILNQLMGGQVAYNMPCAYVFEGKLDRTALEFSFASLFERHESLRTIFKEDEQGDVHQYIRSSEQVNFHIHNEDIRSSVQQEELLKTMVEQEFVKPFDLSAGPLLRANLYQLADHKWVFTYVMHHVISDGWSMGILIKELLQSYNTHLTGKKDVLPPLRIQYKDYADWQQAQLAGTNVHGHKEYWLDQFSGELPVLNLTGDKVRPLIKTYSGRTNQYKIKKNTADQLRALTKSHRCTMFMGLLAAVNALLYRYTGQEDIIIGSPIAGRGHSDLENQIGFFVNTLALRSEFKGTDSCESLLRKTRDITLAAYEHQIYPFDQLVEDLNLQRDMSRNALFDIMLIFKDSQTEEHQPDLLVEGLKVEGFEGGQHHLSKFDITFYFNDTGVELDASIEYNTDIFSEDTISRLWKHFEGLLESFSHNPEQSLNKLAFLSESEKHELLENFNDTAISYPKDGNILRLFKEQVGHYPENIALVSGNRELTYQQLDHLSNRLAYCLAGNHQVKRGDIVGIGLERNEWMLIAILGILRVGATYLPLDIENPQERNDYMIKDSNCRVVIDDQFIKTFNGLKVDPDQQEYPEVQDPGICALIYTTGSTGVPKGVLISSQNLHNRLNWMWAAFPFKEAEVCIAKTSLSFVDHMWELFGPLLKGIKLIMFHKHELLDVEKFIVKLGHFKVTRIVLVPSLLKQLLIHEELCSTTLQNLSDWTCSGEVLSRQLVDDFYTVFKSHRLLNIYGSTEVTADATFFDTSKGRNRVSEKIPEIFDQGISSGFIEKIKAAGFLNEEIIGVQEHKLADNYADFTEVRIRKKTVEEYGDFLTENLNKGLINVASPKFIGHMTGPVPPIVQELNQLMISLNQNLVKFETSGIGTFIERQCVGMLHHLVYRKPEEYYKSVVQDPASSLGVVTNGGTMSNFVALSYTLANLLTEKLDFAGLNKKGLQAALKAYNYTGVVVIGSERSHYSIRKALRALGLGEDSFIRHEMDADRLRESGLKLAEVIREKRAENYLILAIIGIAGSTESGKIDPLTELGAIANEHQVHFHVDAAFGGPYLFSTGLSGKLNGIALADSVTICGHKQLYLPMGFSICLFKSEKQVRSSEHNSKYQARKGSLDLGRYTLEGSRSFLSLVLHGVLNVIGIEGYGEIIESNYRRAQLFKSIIALNRSFELDKESDLNIVLYRYIPESLRDIIFLRALTADEQDFLNHLNQQIQERQFAEGKSFVSYTALKKLNGTSDQVFFRAVLMNPFTRESDLNEILAEQEEIAHAILGLERKQTEELKDLYRVRIGKPIANTKVYILSEALELCPIGVVGEICIAGDCVSAGYVNHPVLMESKFRVNPFNTDSMLFRTGDQGRWLADGNVEFIGRIDDQIKINGYRVDLQEIETCLLRYPGLDAVCVIYRSEEEHSKQLVAYFEGKEELDISGIREHLNKSLLPYMVPAYFIQLDSLPLNNSGKIDKNTLHRLALPKRVYTDNYVAPRSEIEAKLVGIWQDVLGHDKIGIYDNFFEIGGNSLKIIRLAREIRKEFEMEVDVSVLFRFSNIKSLVDHFSKTEEVVEELEFDREEFMSDLNKFNFD
ncbi:condensation domain-containing protein [Pedobacter steynii]|nr:condensation domain-containing protein [Pedobacter steynii]